MSIQWTLVGFQKVKGYDCSQLEVAFLGSPRVEMKLTYFFAIKEGFMVSLKGESKVKLTPPPGVKEEGSSTESAEFELIKKEELSPDKLQTMISALELIASGQEALEKGELNIAKSKFEEALKNSPEFYQRKQVETLIKEATPNSVIWGGPYEIPIEHIDGLIKNLKHEEIAIRLNSARQLGYPNNKRAVEPLIEALKDQDIDVRTTAIKALGDIGDARAVEPLITVLKDSDPDVRLSAAKTLGRLGDKRAISHLERVVKEDNIISVRNAAKEALKKLRQQQQQ